ncbi:hypothetical protein GCM10009122_45560 [Fulvivirga kasyanovii]|uniref:Uncharacterized protein n=1 Tax=Fulvivirga kasyanovii TaxID=396812 RepID=A0ABW9RMW6_9BACT|nr:DUF6686 family protein [Fulvivirga kasyanovii]MTI24270.1 hypothetical protein [Fulvivirga kasyanovii]
MCDSKDYIVLAEEAPVRISWCKHCKTYSLVFGTSYLSLTKQGLSNFKEVLEELKGKNFCYDHFGVNKALLRNNRSSAGIYLSKKEVSSLLEVIEQGTTLKEVYHVLYQ